MAVAEWGEDVVDLAFPGEPSIEFGYEIISCIAQKGYCTVAMPDISEDERKSAVAAAQQLPRHYRMKREIEVGYMGMDSNTKLSIRKHDTPKAPLKDTLSRCDRCLTYVALSLKEIPPTELGFVSKSRTNAFVRTSYKDSFEESILTPESLTEIEETQDWTGDVTSFLNFAQSRTLSMLYMLENMGGDIWLYPKDANNEYSVHIPVMPNKMVIFRHDLADYSYQPFGPSVSLQAWVMKEKTALKHINAVDLNLDAGVAVINPGQPQPTGPPVYVKALHVKMPAEVEGGLQWWALFAGGTDGVTQWPAARWPTEPYYMEGDEAQQYGLSYTKHGGFTSNDQLTNFDNKFFGIGDSEANVMVPGQRWVCETGYTALMKAGYNRFTLQGEPIGTWIGDVGPDWHSFQVEWARYHSNDHTGDEIAIGVHSAITSGRLAYTFDFRGPVSSYDTACSASLVAMNACHTFMFAEDPPGPEHSKALVMGVNTLLGPGSFMGNCAAGMLSHQGRSFTFNRSADGYQRGEGCGAIFLDSQLAFEDKKAALAHIIGTATNQDGRSASITAPNGPSQTAVITKSMAFAGINVNLVTMAECHGTGTALGDPIEVGALQAVMRKREIPMIKISTKSHIGHLEAGAGIAGLTKCIQMIRASCGPPNCHFNIINAHLVVDGYPVFFDTEVVDTGYSSGYCGVSSFGFGGTNSRCDVYSEANIGARKKVHVPLPPPAFPRHIFDMDDEINIVGTAGAWSAVETMVPTEEPGVLTYNMTLGLTRIESFRLMLGQDESRLIYPGIHRADMSAQVFGPDSLCGGRYWTIDGREDGVPAGTVYQITFQWAGGVKRIWWTPIGVSKEAVMETAEHQYHCRGSFNLWNMQPMKTVTGANDTVELSFPVGPHLVEEFQFVRDKDVEQVFYPDKAGGVCGPTAMGHDNNASKFSVRGQQFDVVTVRFCMKDGLLSVTAKGPTTGLKTWGNESTFAITDQQTYYVIGSFDGWSGFIPMTSENGVLKARVTLGQYGEDGFQIVLNKDLQKRLSPSQKGAVLGPSPDAQSSWVITGDGVSEWEIVLDLKADDRKSMVSFSPCDR